MPDEITSVDLDYFEKKMLKTLYDMDESGKNSFSPAEIFEKGGFEKIEEVTTATSRLDAKGLISVRRESDTLISLADEGNKYSEIGLPERRALTILAGKEDGKMPMPELATGCGLEKFEIPIAIGWLKKKGWAEMGKDRSFTITEAGKSAAQTDGGQGNDELLMVKLSGLEALKLSALSDEEKAAFKQLRSRKNLVREKEVISTSIGLSPEGLDLARGGIELRRLVTQLTPEIIKKGDLDALEFSRYDVNSFAPRVPRGSLHPLREIIDEVKDIFVGMGFREIEGHYVESAFWNMDMLFIPQDHPAREMQDTFYLKQPRTVALEDDTELMEIVGSVHENGGPTGSRGWGSPWDPEKAKRAMLRTHTTVNTIRYLYEHPGEESIKVFSVGRVFRKEAIDSTHLPEFHQIEGIATEEGTNFPMLIGLLKEFYRRMGFEKIRMRPGYFPYTEPSMEVEVLWHGRWMELGGSGIFRPEVTGPIGVKHPVLAWGLGLERLAMMRLDLKDIRELYISDIDWLRY